MRTADLFAGAKVTVTLPPDVEGWSVPAGYSGLAMVAAVNGDSVDVMWIGGPGAGDVEPVDEEFIKPV